MRKLLGSLGLAALLMAVAVLSFTRRERPRPSPELLSYQARVAELPEAERARFAQLHSALREAEQVRAGTRKWPATFNAPGLTWVQRGQGLYVNYLGVPEDPARLRWLVLVIEPDPNALKEPPAPEDEEHHTLSDGTGLHVTLWSAPNQGPLPQVVLPFPAAENWTQRLGF